MQFSTNLVTDNVGALDKISVLFLPKVLDVDRFDGSQAGKVMYDRRRYARGTLAGDQQDRTKSR